MGLNVTLPHKETLLRLLDEVAPDDAVVVLHRGRVVAAGDVTTVITASGATDMRSAFIALTGGAKDEPE